MPVLISARWAPLSSRKPKKKESVPNLQGAEDPNTA
jgi:hypothetical protein